jgi:hypothetical protein
MWHKYKIIECGPEADFERHCTTSRVSRYFCDNFEQHIIHASDGQVLKSRDAKALLLAHKLFHLVKLWLFLAESQKEFGLNISDEAIDQVRAHHTVQDEEFEVISIEEKRRRSVGTFEFN